MEGTQGVDFFLIARKRLVGINEHLISAQRIKFALIGGKPHMCNTCDRLHSNSSATPGVTGATPGVTGATPGVTGATPGVTGATPGVTGATQGVTGATQGVLVQPQVCLVQSQKLLAQPKA